MTPLLSLAQFDSGQDGNRLVPKEEREIQGLNFRVVNYLFYHPKIDDDPCL